jgi:hypothetical protein
MFVITSRKEVETIVKGTGAKCVIVDTVQSILNPSAKNKNYERSVEVYDPLRKLVPPHGLEVKPFFKGFTSLNLFPCYTRHEPRLIILDKILMY